MAAFIFETTKQVWPDFPITINLVKEPTFEFVCAFYQRICDEIDEKLEYLTNVKIFQTIRNDKLNRINLLYCKVYTIYYRYLKFNHLTLNDFYWPISKRTILFFRVALYFIIYINNIIDPLTIIISEPVNKLAELKRYEEELIDLQVRNDGLLENIGKICERSDNLKMKIEQSTKLRNHKQHEYDLCKQIINDDDYNHLEVIYNNLQDDIKELDENNVQINDLIVLKKDLIDNLNRIDHLLISLDFENLPINEWNHLNDEILSKQQEKDQRIVKNRDLIKRKSIKQQCINELTLALQKKIQILTKQQNVNNVEMQQLKNQYQSLCNANEIKGQLKQRIHKIDDDINELIQNRDELKMKCDSYLKQLTVRQQNTARHFQQKLQNLSNQLNHL